ncbi:unnamed protein product [Auanema sp. JU1783]|nr:unnamed protein product [Auanema sp. JU1783]
MLDEYDSELQEINKERRRLTHSTASSVDSQSSHSRRRNVPMMYQMYESQYDDLRGTVYGPTSPEFHPVQACEVLKKSFSGLETKDQVIIHTILFHDNFQRQKIMNAYEDLYGKSLLDDLEEECGGYFLEMVQALLRPAHHYDSHNLYKSISNRYGDRSVAIEIACTRSARQLRVIRETYAADYKKSLEKDISVKVEGSVGRILTLLLTKPREEPGKKLSEELINEHVEIFMKNSIEEIAKNISFFESLFIGNSWKHMAAVFDKVDERKKEDKDLETVIRRNKTVHSEIKMIMLTCVRASRNMQLYFAEKLRAAMSGERPDHSTIIRICVSRSEMDLFDICEEYKRKYHRALEYDIQQTCSGEYLRLIISLLSGSSNNNNNTIYP